MNKSTYILLIVILCLISISILNSKENVEKSQNSINTLKLKVNLLNDNDTNKILALHQLFKASDSLIYIQKAIQLSENLHFKKGLIISYSELGKYFTFKSKNTLNALTNLMNACSLAKEIGNDKILMDSYLYIGFIYSTDNPYKAKEYYLKSLEIANKINDEIGKSYCFSALGNFYENTNLDLNLALQYYLKSYYIRLKFGTKDEVASSINETTRTHIRMHNYVEAEKIMYKGLEIAESQNDIKNIVHFYNIIGFDNTRNKNFKKAFEFYQKAYNLGKNVFNDDIEILTKNLAESYYNLGDFKNASKYYNIFSIQHDSLKSKSYRNTYDFSKISAEYESNRNKLNKVENSHKTLITENEKMYKNYLVMVIVLFFAVLLLVLISYFQVKKQNNITAEKLMVERELKANETTFTFMIDNISDTISLVNNEGLVTYTSPSVTLALGYSQTEFVGKTLFEIVHPEELENLVYEFQEVIKIKGHIEKTFVFRILNKNNEYIYIEANVNNQLDNPSISALILSTRAITERIQFQEQLLQKNNELVISNNKLFAYFNSTKEIIYVYDKNFKIIAFNKTANKVCEEMFKKQLSIDDDMYKYVPVNSHDKFTINSNKAFEGIESNLEVCLVINNQNTWWEMNYLPVKDFNGNIIGTTFVTQNINNRKNAELNLIAAKEKAEESERLKTSFLANMSHELRTPMNGILGFSEMMQEVDDIEDAQTFANLINTSSKRLMETLNLILDLSLIESGVNKIIYEDFDLIDEVKNIVKLYQASAINKNLKINTNSEFVELKIHSSLKAIDSVLNNLINNAIKYTPKGEVNININIDYISANNSNIILKISDTGIGIDEKYINIIFDEFRQASEGLERKFEGTGLGLALTKKFIHLINGEVSVESKLGFGSTFTITIPYIKPKSNYLEIQNMEINKMLGINIESLKRVLIVEDDDVSSKLVERLLKGNFTFDVTKSALDAIDKATNNEYDIILMDINLGNGPNGIYATKEIRTIEKCKNTPVIAMTSYAMAGDKENFLNAGCNDYISKPIDLKIFVEMVKKHLS